MGANAYDREIFFMGVHRNPMNQKIFPKDPVKIKNTNSGVSGVSGENFRIK